MVDPTSTKNSDNQDIFAATENHTCANSAADKWWKNMLAVVKLRQKGTTMVSKLPSGVFRHMLEYEFPNELIWRCSQPYIEINCQHDRHFPASDKLSYDNYLVSINEYGYEFQFTLLDGANCGSGESWNNWTSLKIS